MKDIIIIGAGGFGLEIVDLIESINEIDSRYRIKGFLDDNKSDIVIGKFKILGNTVNLLDFVNCDFVIAISDPKIRKTYFEGLLKINARIPNLFHPTANISKYAEIDCNSGVIVNQNSIVSAKVKLSKGVIVDSAVYIGHETLISDYATLYSCSSIAGNVSIGRYAIIGMGAIILQSLVVGENSVIGAGSTVINSIKENVIAFGTPCKVVKEK